MFRWTCSHCLPLYTRTLLAKTCLWPNKLSSHLACALSHPAPPLQPLSHPALKPPIILGPALVTTA